MYKEKIDMSIADFISWRMDDIGYSDYMDHDWDGIIRKELEDYGLDSVMIELDNSKGKFEVTNVRINGG